jgi:glycerophosphoryl diester phosphodiesterase
MDTATGRILLFVELKGDTADIRMVDDAVAMIKERDMVEEAFLISLKYNLIDYCENRYPEIRCAYLTFASFGKTAELNCDYLGLEEEAASVAVIDAIHESGREVLIWTPNSESSQKDFLLSDADYIITDYVSQAQGINKELSERDKTQIIMDEIAFFFK